MGGGANASSIMDTEWERTLTASEIEDDHMITPAQRQRNERISVEVDMDDIELDDNENESQDKKRKVIHGSSDDENSIILQFGSFVNSFNPFGSNDRSKPKEQNESKKVRMDDVQNV